MWGIDSGRSRRTPIGGPARVIGQRTSRSPWRWSGSGGGLTGDEIGGRLIAFSPRRKRKQLHGPAPGPDGNVDGGSDIRHLSVRRFQPAWRRLGSDKAGAEPPGSNKPRRNTFFVRRVLSRTSENMGFRGRAARGGDINDVTRVARARASPNHGHRDMEIVLPTCSRGALTAPRQPRHTGSVIRPARCQFIERRTGIQHDARSSNTRR